MAVGVQGDGYGGVAEHLGDDLRIYVAGQEQGGARMPEVVEAGMGRKTGTFEKPREGAVSEVGGVDETTRLVGEDETARVVERAHLLHLFELAREVGLEGFHRGECELNAAAALLGLWHSYGQLAPRAGEGVAHSEHTALEIHVLPLEGQKLPLTKSGID